MYSLRQTSTCMPICGFDNLLSHNEINQIFNICKENKFERGLTGGNLDIDSTRSSFIKWLTLTDTSTWLYKKIIRAINEVNMDNYNYIIKYIEDLQFTQYTSCEGNQGFYEKHTDIPFGSIYHPQNFVELRKLSLSIQLSSPEEYDGCELKIYHTNPIISNEYTVANKNKGSITFFPSSYMHEVTPIIRGSRYSLVGWVLGPNLL